VTQSRASAHRPVATRVAGLDVWKGGWVAVFTTDGAIERVVSYPDLASFHSDADQLEIIGIDIPLVLPNTPPRRADIEARAILGTRRSSVFNALPLDVIEQPTYQEALQRSRERYGIGVSAQSFALRTRILEARQFALTDGRYIEVHPEVSFATMAGEPLPSAKKSWNGQMMRLELLAGHGLSIPSPLSADAGLVPVDDVLDAGAAAWSASRKARGEAVSLPADPGADEGVIWR
jgi:predicted RNase H-like nuclease